MFEVCDGAWAYDYEEKTMAQNAIFRQGQQAVRLCESLYAQPYQDQIKRAKTLPTAAWGES